MKQIVASILADMVEHEQGQPKHIQHFLKVHAFARYIGQKEQLDEKTLFTLELAALVHDIGINPSLAKYHSSAGQYQQIEGPPLARRMLARYDIANDMIERGCYLVAHHHTYTQLEGLDYRILVEADFLVNLYEDQSSVHAIQTALSRYFTTETGRWLLQTMFLAAPLV